MEFKNIELFGLPWYTPENYERMKSIYTDSNVMPEKYNDWLKGAERLYNDVISNGAKALKVYIDPETFISWCTKRRRQFDPGARMEFVNEAAFIEYTKRNMSRH